jgi:N-acetylglucosaminyldiphosphoundecaprenol N-acetyl-beta-D-mannosaminyltransferase
MLRIFGMMHNSGGRNANKQGKRRGVAETFGHPLHFRGAAQGPNDGLCFIEGLSRSFAKSGEKQNRSRWHCAPLVPPYVAYTVLPIMPILTPAAIASRRPPFSVLGVHIRNVTRREAISTLEKIIEHHDSWPASVFFANARVLNIAAAHRSYRAILNEGNLVFAEGAAVRWAARLQGVRRVENLAAAEFVPAWFRATFDRGHSCFLLGSDALTIELAADFARRTFPGWRLAGYRDGCMTDELTEGVVVDTINAAKPDVLLVDMGSPRQERWIHRHLAELRVPVCLGVGGLFEKWSGKVGRSPGWLRLLVQEPPRMAGHYLIGNPAFFGRVLRERWRS